MPVISKFVASDGVTYDITDGRGMFVGTCATAASAQVKAVTISNDQNFILRTGAVIAVKFTYSNTYKSTTSAPCKMNVNGTGDKNIYYTNTATLNNSTSTIAFGTANYYHFYVYDGTNWVWNGYSNESNTTYSGMTAAEITAGTGTTNRLISPANLKTAIQTWETDSYTKEETDELIEVLPSLVDESTKNIYKLYYRPVNANNLQYTINSDGTITVTGGYGSLICKVYIGFLADIPSSQGLVFSGCPAGGSENTYHSYLYINDNNRYIELGDGVLKDLETGTQYQTMPSTGTITWTLHVINGNTTYPLTFKPMVCSLEDWKVSHSYVPYCESNYELTQRVGVSYNALDAIAMDGSKNKLQNNASSTGIFTVNSDGTVTATVPASNTQTSLVLYTADNDISFDQDMVLSGCPADGSYVYKYAIYLLDANGNIVMIGEDGMADEGITRVIPAGTAFRSVRILIRANIGAQTLTFKPMLCDKDLYSMSPDYIPYAPSNRELYEADKTLDQIKFTPETSAPTSSQRLLFSSPRSNNNLTMLVGKLDSSTNYVQFYVNGVDKGYIKFDVSRNINTWQ